MDNFCRIFLMSVAFRAMPHEHNDDAIYVDSGGCLAERAVLNGQEVIVHYDDVPEWDVTTVDGIPCTTPLRTVIDIAPEMDDSELARIVRHCLDRKLFSRDDAMARTASPDMRTRPGAQRLRRALAG